MVECCKFFRMLASRTGSVAAVKEKRFTLIQAGLEQTALCRT